MRPRTCCLALALASAPAIAQPISLLHVERGANDRPRMRLIELDAATGATTTIGDALDHSAWLYGLGEHGSHNYTALPPGVPGGDADALDPRELLGTSQAVLFGMDRVERVVALSPEDFARLAGRAGAPWAPPGDIDEVLVRRIESSKALVRWTPQPEGVTHSTIATAKRGERAEIRPLSDPTMLEPTSILPVRIYLAGQAGAGATAIATHEATGAEHRALADDKGIAILTLDQPGPWRVEVHHLQETPDDPEASYTVHSATLSFDVIGGVR